MRSFDEFIATNDVRKVSPDMALAHSLKEFSERRMRIALKLQLEEDSAFMVYEETYEALREFIDSILALEGYKSYSHVASIVFLQRFPEINAEEIAKLDNAREKRNLAKYYARPITVAETKELLLFYNKIKSKLSVILKRLEQKKI